MSTITQADYLAMEARLASRRAARRLDAGVGPPVPAGKEKQLHEQILAECARRGWIAIHSRTDCPTTTVEGVPDFLILRHGGQVLFVECKTATGKLTVQQQGFIRWARQLGHCVHVCRSFEDFLALVRDDSSKGNRE